MKMDVQKSGKKIFANSYPGGGGHFLNTKAFTLIELLAVIIVLAVIAVVAVPIVIDVIDDVKKEADLQTAYSIIDTAELFFAESMLDDAKKNQLTTNKDNPINLYNQIEMSNDIPDNGKLYVNNKGQVALSVVINDRCYKKEYYEQLQVLENSDCNLDYVGGADETAPEQDFVIDGIPNENGWLKEDTKVKIDASDNESKVDYIDYCIGFNCTPTGENIVYDSKVEVEVPDSNSTMVCYIVTNKAGISSEKVCTEEIKKDTVSPEFTGIKDITVEKDSIVDLTKDVIVTDSLSGVESETSYDYTPKTVDTSKTGVTEITYTAYDKAGNKQEITRKVIVSADAPYITFEAEDGAINEYGWAKDDFYVTINVKDNTGHGIKEVYVCTSNESDRCEPTDIDSSIQDNKITRLIQTESNNNRICVKATDNTNQTSEVICSDAYKLDKTDPTVGSINVNGEAPSEDWYKEDLTITTNDGIDSLSGHLSTTVNFESITESTEGKVVTVTTKDKAGNASTKGYTLKLDKTIPEASIAKSVVSNKNVLTVTVTPSTTTSNYSYQWYKNGSIVSGATSSSYTTTESGTFKVVVKTGSRISSTSNEITIQSYTVTYNLNGGTGNVTSTAKVEDINTNITSIVPTRSGYTFVGWGSSTTDTSVDYASGASYTGNENKTLYAIWKKTVEITFVGNGATVSVPSVTCDMYNSDTSCKVTFPTITRSGYTIIGFNTSSSATTSQVSVGTEKTVSGDAKYYAITKKEAVTYSITYTKTTGVSSIGATSESCTIDATYNTNVQGTTCNITLPTITASTGYTVSGWYNSSNTKLGNASASISVSTNQTITAKATLNSYTCQAGYYLGANKTSCTQCEAGSYCSGGAYSYSSSVQGKTACPSGYSTSVAGSDAASDCYKTITVTYVGNGATSGSTSSQSCKAYYNNSSCNITLNSNGFTKTSYTFQGWGTGTSSVSHNAGSQYSFSSNTTLYAIWKAGYKCTTGTLTADSSKGANSGGYVCVTSGSYSSYCTSSYQCSESSGYYTSSQEPYEYDCFWWPYECTTMPSCSYATDEYGYCADSNTWCYRSKSCKQGYQTVYYCCSSWSSSYYCPSGWSTYSGSGSSLKCYSAATLGS